MTEKDLEELREARARADDQTPAPSILYRYPVERGGERWYGLYGFEAVSFLKLLSEPRIGL